MSPEAVNYGSWGGITLCHQKPCGYGHRMTPETVRLWSRRGTSQKLPGCGLEEQASHQKLPEHGKEEESAYVTRHHDVMV